MKKWRECRGTPERIAALCEAFRLADGNVSDAATLLGVNRQYLYQIMETHGDPRRPVGGVGAVGLTDTVGPNGAVGPTLSDPLTYGRSGRILRTVSSAATVDVQQPEKVVRTAIDLPQSLLDRLEQQALRDKQNGETGRMSKSHVVVKALLRYFDEQSQ